MLARYGHRKTFKLRLGRVGLVRKYLWIQCVSTFSTNVLTEDRHLCILPLMSNVNQPAEASMIVVSGGTIRQIRERLGLSRDELVRRATLKGYRLQKETLTRIETGRTQSLDSKNHYAIAKILGVPMEVFISEESEAIAS